MVQAWEIFGTCPLCGASRYRRQGKSGQDPKDLTARCSHPQKPRREIERKRRR